MPTLDTMFGLEAAARVKEMNAVPTLSKRKDYEGYPDDKADKRI